MTALARTKQNEWNRGQGRSHTHSTGTLRYPKVINRLMKSDRLTALASSMVSIQDKLEKSLVERAVASSPKSCRLQESLSKYQAKLQSLRISLSSKQTLLSSVSLITQSLSQRLSQYSEAPSSPSHRDLFDARNYLKGLEQSLYQTNNTESLVQLSLSQPLCAACSSHINYS